MTASQNLETKREQFRSYLEKEGILESITKALVTLYEESDKPKEALAFVRKNIAAADLDSMKAQVESLSQENEKLKSEVASLGKEKAELQIKVQNLEDLQKEMADKAAASAAAAAVVESPKSEDVEKKEAGQDQHMEDVEVESPKPEVEETKQEVQDQPMEAVAEVESTKYEDVLEKKEVAQEQTIEEAKVELLSKPKSEDVKEKEVVVQEEPMEEQEPKPEKEIAVEAGGAAVPESKSISEESSSDALAAVDVAAEKPKPDEPKEKVVEASEKPVEGLVGGDVAKE